MEELADNYIRVATPSNTQQWWYKPTDTTLVQSPSAHGAPNEGALFGFRPLLYPWPPAAILVGFFAGAVASSYAQSSGVLA